MWILKVAWLVVAEVAHDLCNVAVVVSAAVVAWAVICMLAVDVFVVWFWCLCGPTVCATIDGTDSWVTKMLSTQTVGNLCGQSVWGIFVGTDSWVQ